MKLELSKRLREVASYIPDHAKVADIGADHAFLLLYVAEQGRLHKGIVGELNKGPFENARRQIQRMGYTSIIDARMGDGLSVLELGEVDVIVLAGMGGTLMTEILEAGKSKLDGVKRLILQPNVGGHRVRKWLYENQWHLVDETLVEEAGILYEIIVAEPGDLPGQYDDDQLTKQELLAVGPILWRKKHPLLKRKCTEEWLSRKRILEQLASGKTEQAKRKQLEMEKEYLSWERVKTCLSADVNS
ncbi:tRNA (adenine(22)-N(1))-methyltransferase [Thermoflavimicrobium dichotomicum]|uniref:tRNA (Adenine22-N1)-methyltransferase n=1 Tax=Thermoflavimicrobium dichotomicum TaxID=46223 RepID=A0A1I3NGG0_9BACL|nr:class I SAM-dependent methyltransferase [Thermoflavimicrobium dichotomicum]SFJ08252.1 tRNA (adenine22-N1)-methyltransferase [Thermoflavimicrobium dichotomicum]